MAGSTMIGTGLTPEGINQNDVVYEFMMENTWRTKPRNLTQWFVLGCALWVGPSLALISRYLCEVRVR